MRCAVISCSRILSPANTLVRNLVWTVGTILKVAASFVSYFSTEDLPYFVFNSGKTKCERNNRKGSNTTDICLRSCCCVEKVFGSDFLRSFCCCHRHGKNDLWQTSRKKPVWSEVWPVLVSLHGYACHWETKPSNGEFTTANTQSAELIRRQGCKSVILLVFRTPYTFWPEKGVLLSRLKIKKKQQQQKKIKKTIENVTQRIWKKKRFWMMVTEPQTGCEQFWLHRWLGQFKSATHRKEGAPKSNTRHVRIRMCHWCCVVFVVEKVQE